MSNAKPDCNCNFCGTHSSEVDYVFQSPFDKTTICDDCVCKCMELLEQAEGPEEETDVIPALLH
jgi:ATP-dependent protease Clp ATPase subunit